MHAILEFLAELFGVSAAEASSTVAHSAVNSLSKDTPLLFYNTLSKSIERFSVPEKTVRMYNCGPTVYGPQHIGNLSMFVFTDILRRTLEYNGYRVEQVINFTDVGHLSSDEDEGEDKMTKGLKRDGLALTLENMKTLAKKYAEEFKTDLKALNIDTSRITFPYASEYIPAQIRMIQKLESAGYAYATSRGIYFDTSAFKNYGALGGINLKGLKEGARIGVDSEKRNPTDFNLWKLDSSSGWDSPWGRGFPGWHIECSAMIREILGETIDIHTGGIEHIPVHHNNEIAQSQCAFGKPLARFWMHREHIRMQGGKMAKSEGNVVYLKDIVERGYSPLSLRYFFLNAHYRSPAVFSWESLDAASTALSRLQDLYGAESSITTPSEKYIARFFERMNDDLDTPGALAVLWEMTRDASISTEEKRATARLFDTILGVNLEETHAPPPREIIALGEKRESARAKGDWKAADEIRKEIEQKGYTVRDTERGPRFSIKK